MSPIAFALLYFGSGTAGAYLDYLKYQYVQLDNENNKLAYKKAISAQWECDPSSWYCLSAYNSGLNYAAENIAETYHF